MNKIWRCLSYLSLICLLIACTPEASSKKIGVILPIEHQALEEIVAGFKQQLSTLHHEPLKFKIVNAQGDLNLQRALIAQMNQDDYVLIALVGTDLTQMGASMIKTTPLVGLAAVMTEQDRHARKPCQLAVVNDQVPAKPILELIHRVYPNLTELVLVHSTSEKVLPDVQEAIAVAKTLGIHIKPLLAPTLNELYSVARSIPAQTQGILVLRDNLIVSGISTLALAAKQRHLPLITADQGSVQQGAGFGLGVKERTIGALGAGLAEQILQGKAACSLAMVFLNDFTVFVNPQALTESGQALEPIQAAAKQSHYPIEVS